GRAHRRTDVGDPRLPLRRRHDPGGDRRVDRDQPQDGGAAAAGDSRRGAATGGGRRPAGREAAVTETVACRPVSWLRLERYALGELASDVGAEIDSHMTT